MRTKTKTTSNAIPLLLMFLLCSLCSQAQSQSWQWAKQVGSQLDNSGNTGNEMITDVKADKYGNVYAVGYFYNNPIFNNAATSSTVASATGGYGFLDAYLIKYNSCGTTLWWRRMGGISDDIITSLVLDDNGQVIVVGNCASTFTLDGNNIQSTVMSISGNFLARFDTSGSFIDIHTNPISPNPISILGSAKLYKVFITSQGDYFVSSGLQAARVNTLGVVTNTYSYAQTSGFIPIIRDVVLDKNDNVYLSGSFTFTTTIASGIVITTTNVPQGSGNGLIMKFSPTGNLLWHKTSTPSQNLGGDVLRFCTIDTSGTKVITGGVALLGISVFGYTVSSQYVSQYANVFYVFDANTGNLLSGATGTIFAQDFISPRYTDRDNNIYCTGTIARYLAFNTATYTSNPHIGGRQSCIGKFTLTGNSINTISVNMLPQSGSMASGGVMEDITSLDVNEQGNIYIGGMFGGTLDSAGTAVIKYGGTEDGFTAKYGFACNSNNTNLSPLPPTSLAAVYQATLTNHITWIDNAQYETGFELWSSTNGGAYSLLATLPANTTSYTHTGLSYNSNYCYKARAVNGVGYSVYTNIDCAATPTTATPQVPNTPLNLTATNNGSLTNNVSWTDNSTNEDNFVLYYKIGAGSSTFSVLATLPANTTSYTHTALTYSTVYCYQVVATNGVGSSAPSNTACVSTPANGVGIAEFGNSNRILEIYPNPTAGDVTLRFASTGGEATIEVFDLTGKMIYTENINTSQGENIRQVSMPKEKGLYVLKLSSDKAVLTKKVVVE
ncbi:MAG: T9SS type A sorting domain-containing protein [Bacteroidetes bacterium]|nr:T9SS type A sorting domain-containing protein [Bacteroidota bacterium]